MISFPINHVMGRVCMLAVVCVRGIQFDAMRTTDTTGEIDLDWDRIDRNWAPGDVDIAKPYGNPTGRRPQRPHFSKTLRCKDDYSSSCEECTGEDNCWFSKEGQHASDAGSRVNWHQANGSEYSRFLKIVHMACTDLSECEDPNAFVCNHTRATWRVHEITGGALDVYFDGSECQHLPSEADGAGWTLCDSDTYDMGTRGNVPLTAVSDQVHGVQGWLKFRAENSPRGGHSIVFEFRPDMTSTTSSIFLSMLTVKLPVKYQECQDTFLCMENLASGDSNAHALRNNNSRLKDCLDDKDDSAECQSWKSCLANTENNTHVDGLKLYLNAALPTSASSVIAEKSVQDDEMHATEYWKSVGQVDPFDNDTLNCLNPEIEDIMAWECDCRSEMKDNCENVIQPLMAESTAYTLENCVRAHICSHRRICNSWFMRSATCLSAEMIAIKKTIENQELLQRRLLSRREAVKTVDQTTTAKQCA